MAGLGPTTAIILMSRTPNTARPAACAAVLTINTVNASDNFSFGLLRDNGGSAPGNTGTLGILKTGPGTETFTGTANS